MHVVIVVVLALLLKAAVYFFGSRRADWKKEARTSRPTPAGSKFSVVQKSTESVPGQIKVVVCGASSFLAR